MSTFGPAHKLIVSEVGESEFEFADYEIEHLPGCEVEHSDVWDCDLYECGVGFNEREAGLRWVLKYSGTPITEPGEYMIQAWAETIRGYDFTEYDGGICLVDPNEADDDASRENKTAIDSEKR